jgi:hypothetical protein
MRQRGWICRATGVVGITRREAPCAGTAAAVVARRRVLEPATNTIAALQPNRGQHPMKASGGGLDERQVSHSCRPVPRRCCGPRRSRRPPRQLFASALLSFQPQPDHTVDYCGRRQRRPVVEVSDSSHPGVSARSGRVNRPERGSTRRRPGRVSAGACGHNHSTTEGLRGSSWRSALARVRSRVNTRHRLSARGDDPR